MIGIIWIGGFFMGMSFALFMTFFFDTSKKKKRKLKPTDLFCFDCEIKMPVKEKNGQFYCSNCGLPH
jgi:hypothetical protein